MLFRDNGQFITIRNSNNNKEFVCPSGMFPNYEQDYQSLASPYIFRQWDDNGQYVIKQAGNDVTQESDPFYALERFTLYRNRIQQYTSKHVHAQDVLEFTFQHTDLLLDPEYLTSRIIDSMEDLL